jgi:hypothetical protein
MTEDDEITDIMTPEKYITFFNKTQVYVDTDTTLLTYSYNRETQYSHNVLGYVDKYDKEHIYLKFDLAGEPASLIEFLESRYHNLKYYWKGQCLFVYEHPEDLKYNLYLYGKQLLPLIYTKLT